MNSSDELELRKNIQKIYLTEQKKILNEKDSWWNFAGDIIGIFDPTGVVDAINGINRISKGDYFFGILSLISAVPYVGDAIAKPIMGIGKGSRLFVNTNKALELARLGKTNEAAKLLNQAASGNKLMNSLVHTSANWATNLKRFIDNIPGNRLFPGAKNMIKDWCNLFMNVAKRRKQFQSIAAGKAAKIIADPKTATEILTGFKQLMNKSYLKNIKLDRLKGVSLFKPWSSGWMAKYFWPGVNFGLIYRNRELSSLINRTKFYWGFIEYLTKTVGSFVPGDVNITDLPKYVNEDELNRKLSDYANSTQGKEYWDQDMKSVIEQESTDQSSSKNFSDEKRTSPSKDKKYSDNPIDDLLNIFMS